MTLRAVSNTPELVDHPVASLFPLMTPAELDALAADIAAHGLLEPIWLAQDGSILDGRNRYRACLKAGVSPATRVWSGDDRAAVEFVASMNLHRRHLTNEQRAFIAAEMANMRREDRARLQAQPGRKGFAPMQSPDGDCVGPKGKPLVSQREAAAAMQIPKRSVEKAQAVRTHAPELKERVLSGAMTLTGAEREALSRASGKPVERIEAGNVEPAKVGVRNPNLFKQRAASSEAQISRAIDTVESMLEAIAGNDPRGSGVEVRSGWTLRLRKCRTEISRFIAKCEREDS